MLNIRRVLAIFSQLIYSVHVRKHLLLLGSTVLLGACTFAPLPEQNTSIPTADSGSGDLENGSGAIVLEEGASPVQEEKVQVYEERLLANGVLEIGKVESGVTLLVFTEHHAAYSKDFAEEQLPRLLSEFVATNQLKIQIAILPLQKYPGSIESAKALYCAGKQGKGLPMHRMLFTQPDALKEHAEVLQLDVPTFETCLRSDDATAKINQQKTLAAKTETTLIPTFFLDGEKFVGLPYYADLHGRIEEAMR